MNRNSITKPRFEDNVDSLEDNNETLNLSPIQRSQLNKENDQSLEQMESYSQDDSILTHKFRTTAIRPLYRPIILNTRSPNYIESVKTESNRPETIQIKEESYASSFSKNRRAHRNSIYLPEEGFKDLLQYSNFQEDSLSEIENDYECNSDYYQSNYSSSIQKRNSNTRNHDFFIPDQSQEIISEEYEATPPYKKSQNARSLASQSMSNSSRIKSRIRRYGKNRNEKETALR